MMACSWDHSARVSAMMSWCSPAVFASGTLTDGKVHYDVDMKSGKMTVLRFEHDAPRGVKTARGPDGRPNFAVWVSRHEPFSGTYRPTSNVDASHLLVTFVGREEQAGPILHLGSAVVEHAPGTTEERIRTKRVVFNAGHRRSSKGTDGIDFSGYNVK